MGCGASKNSSYSENPENSLNLKGTILIAFLYRDGVVIGCESRASNETRELEHRLTIRDNRDKMVKIGTNIRYVISGVEKDCDDMIEDISKKFLDKGNAASVSYVVETIYEYMTRNLDKSCGALVAGWDASGPQVHRVFVKGKKGSDKTVVNEHAPWPAVLGSGQLFACRIIKDGYNYVMETDDAIQLAFKALFNATYYDKHSGGILQVCHIDREENYKIRMNPVTAYVKFYDLHLRDERKTLLLVVDAAAEPIAANDLYKHFKPNAKLIVSPRVALCKMGHDPFYLHRLVFESEDDADRAYRTTTPHGRTTPSYLHRFPGQVILDKTPSITVYINWSSRELVKFLEDHQCQLQYRTIRN